MRQFLSLACLVVMLGVAVPAQAQLRVNLPSERSAVRLYDAAGSVFSLNKLFSPEHFRMSHSYEMSMSSFGGGSASMGMYTNTMMWQFNQKLAARVDVSYAHNLFGGSDNGFGFDQGNSGRVFLRNAEIAYRPSENVQLHFSVHQSPYGSYMRPYGYGGRSYMGLSTGPQEMFWNDRR